MSGPSNIKEFPDLTNKLAAPTKKSLFERQKAEAEAKKAREEAETAAVYEDFVKSFENDSDDRSTATFNSSAKPGNTQGFGGTRVAGGPAKRHFVPGGRSSGPGSLGPPPNLSRKRALEGSRPYDRDQERERGLFSYSDSPSTPADTSTAFQASDDEEDRGMEEKDAERAAPKPTVQLSSLPPGTSPAVIKSLMPPSLTVDGVRIIPPSGPGVSTQMERKSMSAIVTLAKETPASDIDTVVSTLQNRYLGWGFHLSISRHLSSAALGSLNASAPAFNSGSSSLPFGAQQVAPGPGLSLSRAPPPAEIHRGGFAPPSNFSPFQSEALGRGQPPAQVKVKPPSDINELKLIHKTLEAVLTHGPEFETALMSRPEVQKDERWAWIWDPRSTGGVWYRWRLWEILTGSLTKQKSRSRFGEPPHRLFEGGALWAESEEGLPFELTTQLEELVSDSDYNSSDEDESGDEAGGQRKRRLRFQAGDGPPPGGTLNTYNDEQTYLDPLQKAKLSHLLARLPTTTAKLRKGDVARITAFAISRAGQGGEEVVEMLVDNIIRPFSWTKANLNMKSKDEDGIDTEMPDDDDDKAKEPTEEKKESKDNISASLLIALHLVSDILSASSTSGVRHAWRYRSLFEHALSSRRVFAYLGRLEKQLGWGRLRAEKWRRSIGGVMSLWEGWCVFPAGTQEKFMDEFSNPPLTQEEEAAQRQKEQEKNKLKAAANSKWKAVDPNDSVGEWEQNNTLPDQMDIDNTRFANGGDFEDSMDDIAEESMEDIDGEPMDDIDGEPMADTDGELVDEQIPASKEPQSEELISSGEAKADMGPPTAPEIETAASRAKRLRPKAEDMFADSDDD